MLHFLLNYFDLFWALAFPKRCDTFQVFLRRVQIVKMISSVTFHKTLSFSLSLSLYLWPQEGGIDSQTPFANFVSYETMDNFHGYVGLLDYRQILRLTSCDANESPLFDGKNHRHGFPVDPSLSNEKLRMALIKSHGLP